MLGLKWNPATDELGFRTKLNDQSAKLTKRIITSEAANKIIKAAGLTNLSFVDHVEMVDEIPLLGSGKTNHRALKDPQAILEARLQVA